MEADKGKVALRKESVDRNCELPSKAGEFRMSLSARRAWIEIQLYKALAHVRWSLSARRAWIEIRRFLASWSAVLVALRKESVDRNSVAFVFGFGAKLSLSARRAWIEMQQSIQLFFVLWSLSARRAWIEI